MSSVWTSKYIENMSYPPRAKTCNTKKTTREKANIAVAVLLDCSFVVHCCCFQQCPLGQCFSSAGFYYHLFWSVLTGVPSHSRFSQSAPTKPQAPPWKRDLVRPHKSFHKWSFGRLPVLQRGFSKVLQSPSTVTKICLWVPHNCQ